MKYVLYAIIGWLALSACQPKPADKEKLLEEIDSTMQVQVQTLLKDKMEKTRAYAGQVLVMDAATGKMRVCAGWLRTKDGTYEEAPKCMDRYPLYYMRSTAYLAAMQTGKVKTDGYGGRREWHLCARHEYHPRRELAPGRVWPDNLCTGFERGIQCGSCEDVGKGFWGGHGGFPERTS